MLKTMGLAEESKRYAEQAKTTINTSVFDNQ
jgi:hypothetical protein